MFFIRMYACRRLKQAIKETLINSFKKNYGKKYYEVLIRVLKAIYGNEDNIKNLNDMIDAIISIIPNMNNTEMFSSAFNNPTIVANANKIDVLLNSLILIIRNLTFHGINLDIIIMCIDLFVIKIANDISKIDKNIEKEIITIKDLIIKKIPRNSINDIISKKGDIGMLKKYINDNKNILDGKSPFLNGLLSQQSQKTSDSSGITKLEGFVANFLNKMGEDNEDAKMFDELKGIYSKKSLLDMP